MRRSGRRRVRRTPEEIRQILAEFEVSGLSRKRYSKSKRLSLATLGNWMRRASRQRPVATKTLVPVRVEGTERGSPALIEVVVGGRFGVRVPADFDEDALRRLLRVLESAC